MPRKPEPDDYYAGPPPKPYKRRGEVWAQRISDGALRALGITPEPIPWIKPPKRQKPIARR